MFYVKISYIFVWFLITLNLYLQGKSFVNIFLFSVIFFYIMLLLFEIKDKNLQLKNIALELKKLMSKKNL